MTDSIKITSLTPLEGELHDDDQFLVVDVSDTDGDNASETGKTSRVPVSRLGEKFAGQHGTKGERGPTGPSPSFSYDSASGVLTITTS